MRYAVPLIALLLLTCPAIGQQPRSVTLPANNHETTLFRGLFHFHKIEPEAVEKIGRGYDYSNLIVVVYKHPQNQNVKNICRSTLANGGAVFIAADTDLSVGSYLSEGGEVRITGSKVTFDNHELVDNGQPSRPIAGSLPTDTTSPFAGMQRVATSEPSYLIVTKPPLGLSISPVAAFPIGATVHTVQGQRLPGVGLLALPFAIASGDRSRSQLMVMADPEVFSNRMIYTSGREDNPTDNLRLANRTVQWLKGKGRTKCLFIDWDNRPATKFDEFEFTSIPIGPPPLPPPPVPNIDLTDPEMQRNLTNFVNQTIDQAERNDMMNQGLLSAFGGRKWVPITILAVLLLFLTYLIVRWRATFNWVRKTFRPIPRDPAMLGPNVPVGSLAHRRLELLRSADYGPVVRPVVLQLFQERGLPGEYTGDKLPPVDIDVRRPQYLQEALHTLWATLRSTAPIGYGRWKQLEPLLAAVRAAAADDRWRFIAPSPRDAAP